MTVRLSPHRELLEAAPALDGGGNIASDVSMMQKPVDISEMTLEWVQETNDVIFGDLSKTDRMLLYLMYARSMDMAEARDLPGM
jgi:hypothetical protein